MKEDISQFKEKLEGLMNKKFFFREPTRNDIISRILVFLAMSFSTVNFGLMLLIGGIIITISLSYVIGALGIKKSIPIIVLGFAIGLFAHTSVYSFYWYILHIVISFIFYYCISNRYSKINIIVIISGIIFVSFIFFLFILQKFNYININQENFQNYINNQINNITVYSTSGEKELFRSSVDSIIKQMPVLLYEYIFLYTLLLVQVVTKMFSKMSIIVPVFPKLSRITIRQETIAIYFILLLVIGGLSSSSSTKNSFLTLFLQNIYGIYSWIFIFNGLFTIYYFSEQKNNSKFLKIIATISIFLFAGIYEIIGLIDCLFKIRMLHDRNVKGE